MIIENFKAQIFLKQYHKKKKIYPQIFKKVKIII